MAKQPTLLSSITQQPLDQKEPNQIISSTNEQSSTPQGLPPPGYYDSVIGAFKDDPMLDAMMANIRQRRREIDADDNIE